MLKLNVSNAHDAAILMRDRYLRDRNLKSYNDDLWWITPVSTVNRPAYEYGKYVFDSRPDISASGCLFCGLHVEKGYGKDAEIVYRNKVMDSTWMWHRFLNDLSTDVSDAVHEASKMIDCQLEFHVVLTLPDESRVPIVFETDGRTLTISATSEDLGPTGNLSMADDWSSLAKQINALDFGRLQWHWIDIEIGVPFRLRSDDEDSDRCAKLLQCLRPWFD